MLLNQEFKILIKTFQGLEGMLAKEVQQLGGANVSIGNRMVECFGDLGFVYKANYSLRLALRILVPVFEFKTTNEADFYDQLYRFDWQQYMTPKQTFVVQSVVSSDYFNNSHYVSLKTKDAIVDYFNDQLNERPDVDKDNPDFRINLHIKGDCVTVSLDSSGESLHKRNYRQEAGLAPINEVLAAGLLLLSGWNGKGNFLDPMCGSGTILIEAAMIALNIPPQLHRDDFGFMQWNNFDAQLWELIKAKRIEKITEFNGVILGYDIDEEMVDISNINIKNADLDEFILVKQLNFFESEKELYPLHVLINPPYNERLEQSDPDFYNHLGSTLKHHYPNSFVWIITADLNAKKNIGLRPAKRIKLLNGKLDCDFLCYETYEGSRKASKS